MADTSSTTIQTILSCRCPRCGRGKLFNGVLAVHDKCQACELDLTKGDTGDAGAVPIIIVLGAIIGGLAVWTEFHFSPPWWVHAMIWPTVTVPAAVLLMRLSKSVMIAVQYRHRATEMGL